MQETDAEAMAVESSGDGQTSPGHDDPVSVESVTQAPTEPEEEAVAAPVEVADETMEESIQSTEDTYHFMTVFD